MPCTMMILKPQEIPLDALHSRYQFKPSREKPFLCTPTAIEAYGPGCIFFCLLKLQQKARLHNGLDYLQVFEPISANGEQPLWFIEDDDGGAITALLPSDY